MGYRASDFDGDDDRREYVIAASDVLDVTYLLTLLVLAAITVASWGALGYGAWYLVGLIR
jgi:hypothetical protein